VSKIMSMNMRTGADGLSTPAEVEALADQLSACADQLHARLADEAAAIGALPGDSPARARRRAELEALLDQEQVLRQRADRLYQDAAGAIVPRLGQPQQEILRLTAAAAEKIRKINLLADATGLVAGLVALAGGALLGQSAAIIAALEVVRVQSAAVKAGLPPK
jgi:hypothetical protein